MTFTKRAVALAMIMSFACTSPSSAHHSFAMFDQSKKMVIDGTVSKFIWTNPHVFIAIEAPSKGGKAQRYAIEAASTNMLARNGWKVSSLKVADRVRVTFFPLKSGEKGGLLIQVQRANGTILKQ